MTGNTVKDETLYTNDMAINLYERRNRTSHIHMQKKSQAIKEEQKAERHYFCNQKLYGLLITVLSLVLLLLTHEGLTLAGVIAGIAIMVTKKMVIYNEYYRTHGGTDQWTK